jgi:hypothetical protein
MKTAIVLSCVVLGAPIVGCSSDGDILPSKMRFTPAATDAMDVEVAREAGSDVAGDGKKPRDPNANCVKPGTPNNERGVGGYCEPGRGDCESEQGPRFCTAEFAQISVIEENKWFCSTVCTMDSECGTGAICAAGLEGTGCAPIQCANVDGGGVDGGGVDAVLFDTPSSDGASSDAAPSDAASSDAVAVPSAYRAGR